VLSEHTDMRLSPGPFGRLFVRCGIVLVAGVLLCVPALTRITQRLESTQISTTLNFGKNIDCPPKKVTIAPVLAITSAVLLEDDETVPVARLAPSPDATLPHPPTTAAPSPLRAPPPALFA
jgi:hypothetical protein